MKIKLFRCLAFAVIMTLAVSTFAGDFASLNFIGFSKDGRYLAFEEYGEQDASGYPFSYIYFIDTAKNVYAAPPVTVMIEKETVAISTARARSAALAAKKVRRFGIVKGNAGKLVVSHPLTDMTFDDGRDDKIGNLIKFTEERGPYHLDGDYELLLTPVKITTKDCEAYEQDTFMMELKLTNNQSDTSKILQKDTTIPASRGCALSYRLQDVYLYKGLIAVLINVYSLGFEGPDMRFIAVTGKLK